MNLTQKLIVLALIMVASCKQTEKKMDSNIMVTESTERIEVKSEYVILPYKSEYYWIFENVEPSDLTKLEITELEKIIEIAIDKINDGQKRVLKEQNEKNPNNQWNETGLELQLEEYRRQYIPVINSKGEKEVWCNFFCEDFEFDKWRTEVPIVMDGGNCFFNLKVNLTTGTYKDLRINSIA